jgi:chromosome segregation ATPase
MATLLYCDLDGVERQIELGEEPILIGRGEDCAIRTEDLEVSRRHARVFVDDGAAWIEDLGSANGIYVAGERVERGALIAGELALVGGLLLTLAGADGTAPVTTRLQLATRLRAERAEKAALIEERDALGRRLGELHATVQRLQEQTEPVAASPEAGAESDPEPAARIGELAALRGEREAELEALRGEQEAELEALRGEQEAELEALRGELDELGEKARAAEADRDEAIEAREALAGELAALEEAARRSEAAAADAAAQREAELETARSEAAALAEERSALAAQGEKSAAALAAAREALASAQAELASSHEARAAEQAELASAAGARAAVQSELASATEALASSRKELASAEDELASLRAAAGADEAERAMAALERELADARAELDDLRSRAGANEGERDAAAARVESLEGELAARAARVESLEAELAARAARVESLEGELADGAARVESLEAELAEQRGRSAGLESLEAELAEQRERFEEESGRGDAERRLRREAEEKLLEIQEQLDQRRAEPAAPLGPAAGGPALEVAREHLMALEGAITALRASMRSASDEAAVMVADAAAIDALTTALGQATEELEAARHSMRELTAILDPIE